MNIVEWGAEFPVSTNIPPILYLFTHEFKKVRSFIRVLHSILFLYEDSSILVLPIAALQTRESIQQIKQYVETRENPPPTILYYENKFRVIDAISLPSNDPKGNKLPIFIVFKEDFKYDIIRTTNDKSILLKSNEPMTILDGILCHVVIQNNYISIITRPADDKQKETDEQDKHIKYTVYFGSFSLTNYVASSWALQCEIDEIPLTIYASIPTLYFLKRDGVYGCSLDSKGYRRFPRPLTPISLNDHYLKVISLQGFYIFDAKQLTIFQVVGKNLQKICLVHCNENIISLILIGSRVFALTEESIYAFDILTGDLVHKLNTEKTNSWKTSLEESYGLVFSGGKNYTLSKTEIPPLINLYADKTELMNQMMKVQKNVGTVAAPILLLSNRSPYLAATLLSDEINKEVNQPAIDGSMQAQIKPTLERLNHLLNNSPDVNDK